MFGKRKQKDVAADLNSRRAVLWMHPEAIVHFMVSDRWVINEGHFPEDVQFHSVFWDPKRMVWGVVLISKEFKPVKVGEDMPELPPVKFRWYNAKKDQPVQ